MFSAELAQTLLLGNQINPASSVAQTMAETLSAELEAHSVYREKPLPRVTVPFPDKKTDKQVSPSTQNKSILYAIR